MGDNYKDFWIEDSSVLVVVVALIFGRVVATGMTHTSERTTILTIVVCVKNSTDGNMNSGKSWRWNPQHQKIRTHSKQKVDGKEPWRKKTRKWSELCVVYFTLSHSTLTCGTRGASGHVKVSAHVKWLRLFVHFGKHEMDVA